MLVGLGTGVGGGVTYVQAGAAGRKRALRRGQATVGDGLGRLRRGFRRR